ncbi:MAG: outer membrane beta-barrel protein, partial [Bacteroidota bacterium]
MRRLLCLLPLLLGLLAPAAFGQFRIGAVGGVNASDFDGAAGAELDAAAGFHAGVIVDVGSAPIALRLGLAYVSAGEIIPTPISAPLVPDPRQPDVSVVLGDTLASGYDLTYLAIPIELHYRVERPGAIPYVSVGPELRLPLGDQG